MEQKIKRILSIDWENIAPYELVYYNDISYIHILKNNKVNPLYLEWWRKNPEKLTEIYKVLLPLIRKQNERAFYRTR